MGMELITENNGQNPKKIEISPIGVFVDGKEVADETGEIKVQQTENGAKVTMGNIRAKRITFFGGGHDENVKSQLTKAIDNGVYNEGITNKEKLPPNFSGKTLEMIETQIESLKKWNQEVLGVDVSERIPKLSQITPIPVESRTEYFRDGVRGFFNLTGELAFTEETDPNQTRGYLNHELIHALDDRVMSLKNLKIISDKNGSRSSRGRPDDHLIGYMNLSLPQDSGFPFQYLYEAITELRNIASLKFQQEVDPSKNILDSYGIAYSDGVFLFDTLMEYASSKQGYDITTNIYRGAVLGDFKALSIFNEVFGPKTLKFLSGLNDTHYNPGFIEYLLKDILGLDQETREKIASQFAQKIKTIAMGKKVKLSSGVEIAKSIDSDFKQYSIDNSGGISSSLFLPMVGSDGLDSTDVEDCMSKLKEEYGEVKWETSRLDCSWLIKLTGISPKDIGEKLVPIINAKMDTKKVTQT